MNNPEVQGFLDTITLGQVLTWLMVGAILIASVRRGAPTVKRLNNLLDDWHGEVARPGVAERPGVMLRLEALEQSQIALRTQLLPLIGNPPHDPPLAVVIMENRANVASALSRIEHLDRALLRHQAESELWIQQVVMTARDHGVEVPPWPRITDEELDDLLKE